MKKHIVLSSTILLVWAARALNSELAPALTISGNKFFNSDKTQFFIKGVAYQRPLQKGAEPSGFVDSLALPALCLKDLELFKDLGINCVRVYHIDPTANHDACMDAFGRHGIYVFVDLQEPNMTIDSSNPAWDTELLERYTTVVDSMHGYTNVIGFIAGNEVVNGYDNTNSAAFVKAAIRDTKKHIRQKGYRKIPVGYTSKDDSVTRLDSAQYFVCTDSSTRDSVADFYGINMFEWCGFSSFRTSGYRERTMQFNKMPVPVFFSEYGCNTVSPRPFTEIEALFGPVMSHVWSGGIVYEFFQKENNFGLVEERPNGHLIKLDDFDTVRLRLMENSPQGARQIQAPTEPQFDVLCPPVSMNWQAQAILPPTPDEVKCECLQTTLSCILAPHQDVNEHSFLDELCSKTDCADIMSNAALGEYGKYSGCGLRQKISYVLNKYWLENNREPELCDFQKRAVLITSAVFTDLDNLQASDGRTCREALGTIDFVGQPFPSAKKKAESVGKASKEALLPKTHSNEGVKGPFFQAIWLPFLLLAYLYLTV